MKGGLNKMNQLGNLAVICAQRKDVLFQVLNGHASVCVGHGPEKSMMCANWKDNDKIGKIIFELNFGKYHVDR